MPHNVEHSEAPPRSQAQATSPLGYPATLLAPGETYESVSDQIFPGRTSEAKGSIPRSTPPSQAARLEAKAPRSLAIPRGRMES